MIPQSPFRTLGSFALSILVLCFSVASVADTRNASDNTDAWYSPKPGWALQKLDWSKRTQPSTAWRIVVANGEQSQPRLEWAALTGSATWSQLEWSLSHDWNGHEPLHTGVLSQDQAGVGLQLPALPDGGWWLTVKTFGPNKGLTGLERFYLNIWDSEVSGEAPRNAATQAPSAALQLAFAKGKVLVSGGAKSWRDTEGALVRFVVKEFDGATVRRDDFPVAGAKSNTDVIEFPLPEATPGRTLRVIAEARTKDLIHDTEELWVSSLGDSSPTPDWKALAGESGSALPTKFTKIFAGETVSSFAPFQSQKSGLELQIASLRSRGSGSVQLWVQWGRIETTAGSFDWENLDAYVSFLTQKGVPFTLASAGSVLFGNGPLETWGDWMLNHKGEYKLWRNLPVVSPSSHAWQAGAAAFTQRMVERYRGNPFLAGYAFIGQGMDSGIFTDHFNSITDYGPAARQDFVGFLKKHYDSPSAVSKAWGNPANWDKWTDIKAPSPRLDDEVNLSLAWLDWTDWKLAAYRESTVDLFDPIVAALDPERTVVHYTVKTGPFEHLLKGVQLRSWSTADGAGEDYRMDRINGITRNWRLSRQTESHEVPPANIGYMSDMVAQTLRGDASHVRFNLVWNSLPALFEKNYPANAALQETLRWWTKSAPLREELAEAKPMLSEVGVIISWADLLHRRRTWRWYAMPGDRADKLVRASGFLPVQWLSEWSPEDSWQGLRTILVPEDAMIWDEVLTARLESFVRNGGQLVVWGKAGQYALKRGEKTEAEKAFTWTSRFGAGSLQASAVKNSKAENKALLTLGGQGQAIRPAVTFGSNLTASSNATIQSTKDANGRPIVLEWAHGSGRIRWCVADEEADSELVVAELIKASGVARHVVSSDPAIDGFIRTKGNRSFLILNRFLGFGKKADNTPLEASIHLPGLTGAWTVKRLLTQTDDTKFPVPTAAEFIAGTAKVSLLPREMQVFELVKIEPGEATPAISQDPLAALGNAAPPRILREIDSPLSAAIGPVPEGVSVRQIVFESNPANSFTQIAVQKKTANNEIYALIARPVTKGPHPGLLLLHGGKGSAETKRALLWASRGYVVVTLDIPGIADPEKVPQSAGLWTRQAYQHDRWRVKTPVEDSMMFQSVAGAVQAFHLLYAQPDVDPARVGVHGISWGGYMTAMVCSIVGDKAKAGFSVYGSGYYEMCRYGDDLKKLPATERSDWFRLFDAERRAKHITAHYFIAAASNDFAFWPPAIEKTLAAISGSTNLVYGPNANHKLPVPGGSTRDIWADMAKDYFEYYLQGHGAAFPSVTWDDNQASPRPKTVRFQVSSSLPVTKAAVWYSLPAETWGKRVWKEIPANLISGSTYEASLPAELEAGGDYFALVTDQRPVSVSSHLRGTGLR